MLISMQIWWLFIWLVLILLLILLAIWVKIVPHIPVFVSGVTDSFTRPKDIWGILTLAIELSGKIRDNSEVMHLSKKFRNVILLFMSKNHKNEKDYDSLEDGFEIRISLDDFIDVIDDQDRKEALILLTQICLLFVDWCISNKLLNLSEIKFINRISDFVSRSN